MWSYYDRRIAFREPGAHNVLNYFLGLGVRADLATVNAELAEVRSLLRELPPAIFLDVGAGPSGEFTSQLPGRGCALDQSHTVLRNFRKNCPTVPVVRADAMLLPVACKSVGRVFISHVYGLLLPDERAALLAEARRVANEIVILDSGRPPGAQPEQWQTRSLPDQSSYPIFRRHLDIDTLANEIDGEALFDGQFFVMAAARTAPRSESIP
jgi:hypothetical protein